MYRDFALSVRGFSHVKEDLKCQDSSCAIVEDNGAWAVAVVADGHGGKDYFRSDVGSRLAVEAAVQVVREYLADMDAFVEALHVDEEKILRRMEAGILSKWSTGVQEYDEQNPELTEWEQQWCAKKGITVKEDKRKRLYGTTLVLSVLSERFVIAIQNGDGACTAVYADGSAEFFLSQGEDDQAANITQSLCNSDAIAHFEHRCELFDPKEEVPQADNAVPCEEVAPVAEPVAQLPEPAEGDAAAVALWRKNGCFDCGDAGELNDDDDTALVGVITAGTSAEEAAQEMAKLAIPPDYFDPKPPVAFLLSTDGLINSCVTPSDFLKFNRRILSLMDDSNIRESLERHLFDERSTKGSQDDISVAIVFKEGLDLVSFRPS